MNMVSLGQVNINTEQQTRGIHMVMSLGLTMAALDMEESEQVVILAMLQHTVQEQEFL